MQQTLLLHVSAVAMGTFALLAIMNPFGNLPVFISMTEDLSETLRKKLFKLVILTALVIVTLFTLIGNVVMEKFFQVNLSELRIAGGIILLVMGLKNILAPKELRDHSPNEPNADLQSRIVPMAFPILVGPGTLSTVIILNDESGLVSTLIAILVSFSVILLLFTQAKLIEKLLGKLVLFVLSRIMQVFIMAVGAKMLVVGLNALFPILNTTQGG